MALTTGYPETSPSRDEVDAFAGPTVVDFGTDWCGFCRSAQPLIAEAFAGHEQVRHVKVEDGAGRALGRSYRVKLWPTLIFLDGGKEVARLVRPESAQAIKDALQQINPTA
ncbi:thioredoxin family protein [Pigmentiphaga aceris]|uniref:Thioredoxin family protein n=1 Tax=Pigmentiphaga aceris TaxID=1940612 RepID=A0A5C0AUD7_9BURK|nr:thioredoxin family protein [Pigmentiphaga aceris]QEI04520.1 thioredoxin family protein [Pigmentiphaga aceris]